MQAAAILVLVCACAANAQNIPPLPGRSSYRPPSPLQRKDIASDPEWINSPSLHSFSNSFEYLSQESTKTFPSKPESPWVVDSTSIEEDNDPEESTVSDPQPLPSPPEVWTPPPYSQSLKDYNEAIVNLKNHFTADAYTDKNSKNFRYIVIAHVIDQLSKIVAEEGWAPYELNYSHLLRTYIEQAMLDPRGIISQLMCSVLDPAAKQIQRVQNIIDSPVVEFVCKAQPTACDTVIFAFIKSNYNIELEYSANVLLSVGRAASNFLINYAPAFDAISTQNAYLYLSKSADFLRELVSRNAEARMLLFPNGSWSCFQ